MGLSTSAIHQYIIYGVETFLFLLLSGFYIYRFLQHSPRWIPYQHAFFYCFAYALSSCLPIIIDQAYTFSDDEIQDPDAFVAKIKKLSNIFGVVSILVYSILYISYVCLIASLLSSYIKHPNGIVMLPSNESDSIQPSRVENINSDSSSRQTLKILSKLPYTMILFTLVASISRFVPETYQVLEYVIYVILILEVLILIGITIVLLVKARQLKDKVALGAVLISALLQLVITTSLLVWIALFLSSDPDRAMSWSTDSFTNWLGLVSILVLSFDLKKAFYGGEKDLVEIVRSNSESA